MIDRKLSDGVDWSCVLRCQNDDAMTATDPQPAAPAPKPRWYRLTPDRCVLGLLAVEGFLLLSEWFHLVHKGWTVLIAIAVVAAVLLLMLLWFLAALLLRLRFQYSLSSLLLLTVVVAILCSWLATETMWARAQRAAVEALRAAGGTVEYDFEVLPNNRRALPPSPVWLRKMFGIDFFADVRSVDLAHSEITDTRLASLQALRGLQTLWLPSTAITDAGLVHLEGLSELESLDLYHTQITDAGLVHLQALHRLEWLWLYGTKVSKQGVHRLQQALPNCHMMTTPPP
jgi:hypothetical protein